MIGKRWTKAKAKKLASVLNLHSRNVPLRPTEIDVIVGAYWHWRMRAEALAPQAEAGEG